MKIKKKMFFLGGSRVGRGRVGGVGFGGGGVGGQDGCERRIEVLCVFKKKLGEGGSGRGGAGRGGVGLGGSGKM